MRDLSKGEARRAWSRAHYETANENDRLIMNLRDMSHMMRFWYEGRGSQKRILIVLNELGGSITQRELTERLGIQPGSASEVIAKLESAGYLTRAPSESDRRTVDVVLTQAGKQAAQEAKEQRVLRHKKMFACLSEEEKGTLLMLLERVNQDWKKRNQEFRKDRDQSFGKECGGREDRYESHRKRRKEDE